MPIFAADLGLLEPRRASADKVPYPTEDIASHSVNSKEEFEEATQHSNYSPVTTPQVLVIHATCCFVCFWARFTYFYCTALIMNESGGFSMFCIRVRYLVCSGLPLCQTSDLK